MDGIPGRVAALAEKLSAAETIEDLQRRYLDGVGSVIRAFGAGIYVFDPATKRVRAIDAVGVSDFFLGRYEEVGRELDPVLRAVIDRGSAVDSHQLMSPERWTSSDFYGEVLRLHRMASLLQAPVVCAGDVVDTLNFGRHADQGPFSDEDRAVADLLGRLVGVAVAGVSARAEVVQERDRALATLDLCREAVVVTDMTTGERTINAAARAVLGQLEEADRELDRIVAYPERIGTLVTAEAAVRVTAGARPAQLQARTTALPQVPSVVVSFLDLATGGERAPLALPGVLTSRERDVAELAAGGLHDREIAERLFPQPTHGQAAPQGRLPQARGAHPGRPRPARRRPSPIRGRRGRPSPEGLSARTSGSRIQP